MKTHTCEQIILKRGLNFPHYTSCKNITKVFKGKKYYCKIHDPDVVKERQERRDKKKKFVFKLFKN